jgi:tetratricopeptide (TPR) repeat protein
MEKKHIVASLVVMNLVLVFCVGILLVLNKSGKKDVPVTSNSRLSDEHRDANLKSQSSNPPAKPEDIIACFGIGKKERRQKAMEDYSQIMRTEPPYLGVHEGLYKYAKSGQWDKAQEICDHFSQYSEDKREALYSLAWLRTKQGNYAEAIKISKELTANYPEFVKSYVTLAWIAVKEGRNEDAVAACTYIIKLAPDNIIGYYGLGRLYAFMDKPTEAIASYSDAIRVKPNFAEAHLFLGLVYCQQGKWADAVKAFNNALSIDRGYEQAYLFLAVAYDELGLYKEESQALEQAFDLSTLRSNTKEQWRIFGIEPDYARVNCSLAEAYARIGEYQKAQLSCQDAVTINPAFPEAYYNMALSYLLLGNTKSALEQRDKLISLKANEMAAKLDGLISK